jgi:hypothetical protein
MRVIISLAMASLIRLSSQITNQSVLQIVPTIFHGDNMDTWFNILSLGVASLFGSKSYKQMIDFPNLRQ